MPDAQRSHSLGARLLFCSATAVIVWVTAYLAAWIAYRGYVLSQYGVYQTRQCLELLREDIEHFQETTGRRPASLSELESVKQRRVPVDQAGRAVDGWGRPLRYEVNADSVTLFSYGRDGEPGGFGPDADMYAGEANRWPGLPTLGEYLTMPGNVGVHVACILAGVIAFPLCLLQVREQPGRHPSLARALLSNLVTALFALLAASFIAAIHIQPGH